MQGDAKVVDYLNQALKHELTAVNQYWLHYRLLDHWGYRDLAKKWRVESIEEMQHADTLTARILFLDGHPNMQSLNPLRIGQNVKEIIDCDLAAENEARRSISKRRNIATPSMIACPGTCSRSWRPTRRSTSTSWRSQLDLIAQVGLQLYSQKHIGKLED